MDERRTFLTGDQHTKLVARRGRVQSHMGRVGARGSGSKRGLDLIGTAHRLRPGQELGSGNIRAFAVLAPCKANGSDCETGLDCCGGSCTMGKCGMPSEPNRYLSSILERIKRENGQQEMKRGSGWRSGPL